MCGFDLESTSVNPFSARPCSYGLVLVEPGRVRIDSRIVNPDMPIPPEATEIHGITDKEAGEGMPLDEAIEYLVAKIKRLTREGIPIVTMNGSYDATIIESQAKRLGLPTLMDDFWDGPMLDLFVLDRHVDKWRKGKRKLADLCEHYGVKPEELHDAASDALGSVLCVQALAAKYPNIARYEPADLHRLQVKWRCEQQESLSEYLVSSGEPAISPGEMSWPIQTQPEPVQ